MKNKQQPPLSPELLAQFGGCQGVFRWKDQNREEYIGKIRLLQWDGVKAELKLDLKWLIAITSPNPNSRNPDPKVIYPTRSGILDYTLIFENQKYAVEDGRIGFFNRDPHVIETVYVSTRGEDIVFSERIRDKAHDRGLLPNN